LTGGLQERGNVSPQHLPRTEASSIPANHIDLIFEICHFSPVEKKQFLEAYRRGHPKRFAIHNDAQLLKAHTVYLPDLGDDARNEQLHSVVSDFIRQITRVMKVPPKKDRTR
jgi:hypothetical protein